MAVKPASTPDAPAQKKPVFSLERLRRECAKLFGVSTSTFDGAALGLQGEFSVEDLAGKIAAWQNKSVFPTIRKEGK